MGVKLNSVAVFEEINLQKLSGKIVAIDAFNMLYQFLATIRGADGTPLKTADGKVTSHLVGLFARTSNFLEKGMKPLFVFDGESPEFKRKERERRKELKMQAMKEYEMAQQEKDVEAMKKYAARTSLLTGEMVDDAKRLLDAMGVPWIQAKSEGEAEAARLVSEGKAYASASEDYDSLLFGSPRLVRQLSVTGKRRVSKKLGTYTVQPQLIMLDKVLNDAGLDRKQLIALGILVGTDFNIGGVKGIGPKKGLKMVKEYGKDFEKLFNDVEYDKHCETPWQEIMEFFLNPPDSGTKEFEFKNINEEKLKSMLVGEYEFSEDRVNKFLDRMSAGKKKGQSSLNNFFG